MIESFTGNQLSAGAILENINHPRDAFDVERNDSSAARNLNFECDRPDTDIARWLRLLQQYVDMMGTKYSSTVD